MRNCISSNFKVNWHQKILNFWYPKKPISRWYRLLFIWDIIAAGILFFRRALYVIGIKKTYRSQCPVVVVGNVTVGGTGKTPTVRWLATRLLQKGLSPVVLSRGYGGLVGSEVHRVLPTDSPEKVGDEALLLARTLPYVYVCADRVKAIRFIESLFIGDVIVLDDGLQCLALTKHAEIALVDAERQCGNGHFLPFGPLREPPSRLLKVDAVLEQVSFEPVLTNQFQLSGDVFFHIHRPELTKKASDFSGQVLHAVAGIANPDRFFKQLNMLGLRCVNHPFPDHHTFSEKELNFPGTILMTEKDAVKCSHFPIDNIWYLPVAFSPHPNLEHFLLNAIRLY